MQATDSLATVTYTDNDFVQYAILYVKLKYARALNYLNAHFCACMHTHWINNMADAMGKKRVDN